MSVNAVVMREALDAVVRDLKTLDFNNLSAAGRPVKILGVVLMCLAILFAGYWFTVRPEAQDYADLQSKEQALKQTFLQQKALAVNLPAYKQQVKDMQKSFGVMLQQLPNRNEISEILNDVSQTAIGRGLKIALFKPNPEKPSGFYAEKSIAITVRGTYHQLGEFVSDLAALPRIVVVDDIQISSAANSKNNVLTMSAVAKTYRYLGGGGK